MPYTPQVSGIWDHAEIKNLYNGIGGYGVLSGMALSVTGSSMVVSIAAGTIKSASGTSTYSGGTKTLSNGDATNPRTDLIIWDDSAGDVAVREGTPTEEALTQTKAPALDLADDNDLVLGKVYIAAGVTVIASSALFQRRLLIPGVSDKVVKSADESVASSTTLQNDDELKLPLEANTDYAIEAFLTFTAHSSADLKFGFTWPNLASGYITGRWVGGGGVDGYGPLTSSGSTSDADGRGDGSPVVVRLWGSIFVGANAGDLQLQWAQNTSHATATKVKAGSWLEKLSG